MPLIIALVVIALILALVGLLVEALKWLFIIAGVLLLVAVLRATVGKRLTRS